MMKSLTLTGKELKEMDTFQRKTGASRGEVIDGIEKHFKIGISQNSQSVIDASERQKEDLKEGNFSIFAMAHELEDHPGAFDVDLKGKTEWEDLVYLAENLLEKWDKKKRIEVTKMLFGMYPCDHQTIIYPIIEDEASIVVDEDYKEYIEVVALREACFNYFLLGEDSNQQTRIFPEVYKGKIGIQINGWMTGTYYNEPQLLNKESVKKMIEYLTSIESILT